jgi:hypothetical protein
VIKAKEFHPGVFKVPMKNAETKGLRGTTSLGSYLSVKNKRSGHPSSDVRSLVGSVVPKSMGGETMEVKSHNSTMRTIPLGLLGGTSRANGTTGGFPVENTRGNCTTQLSLSFDAEKNSNVENAMYLFDSATSIRKRNRLRKNLSGLTTLVTLPMEQNTIWKRALTALFVPFSISLVSF